MKSFMFLLVGSLILYLTISGKMMLILITILYRLNLHAKPT